MAKMKRSHRQMLQDMRQSVRDSSGSSQNPLVRQIEKRLRSSKSPEHTRGGYCATQCCSDTVNY
jgi:hypothetical protein